MQSEGKRDQRLPQKIIEICRELDSMSDNSDIPIEGLRVKSRVYLYFVVVMTPWLNPCYVRSLQCNQNTYYKS